MRRTLVTVLAAGLLLVGLMGPAVARPASPGKAPTIASTAVAAGSFDTLVAALICTDLVGLVDSPSDPQLTVFAPTDDAFADLGLTADNICDAFDSDSLTAILADHVVVGRYPLGRVAAAGELTAFSGRTLSVADDLAPKLVATDINTANGVIHVIDEVLLF
jgi:uncharacterized surface protein with fasciclin (FAS1) repeats